jgi:hypothetical protein
MMSRLKGLITLVLLAISSMTWAQSKGASRPATVPAATGSGGLAYTGVTDAMWLEIEVQRTIFADPNDCRSRVANIPRVGTVLGPCDGRCISAALAGSRTVILKGGTYRPSGIIDLGVGGALVGAPGDTVIIDASAVTEAVRMRDHSVLANISVRDAIDVGLNFLGTGALAYQVSVGRTGLPATANGNGIGFGVHWGASYNCLVSTEAYDTWNETGQSSVTNEGGNADGYRMSFGGHHNTLIDAHAYRNGDDGIDFWEGGVGYVYFSSAFDNGKTTGKAITGDGNGIKLGRGNARHYFYKTRVHNNKANGFDLNGNLVQPMLVKSEAFGNGKADYSGVTR